ncbi:hypothetical protein C7999DRAFT_15990 [Corynascus novoguineensis]|uniref:Uncharacterized protein n=1 Tax=Corynascus novoguineensis TaxID=1126955 RepID=A0AAN7HLH9_9PEZI|nr:hypothetical protein C7999DRAFT_15990 [Corynascus novoguineensis]
MRAPSGGHNGQEQQCCISSDAEGRTWISFPDLSHPVSVRPVPESFYHLDNVGSEDNGTATAQVGRAEILIPPSQKVENNKWFKWVCQPTSPVSSRVTVEGSRVSLGHHVSRRVSESRPPGQLQFPSSNLRTGFTSGSSNQISPKGFRDTSKLLNSGDSSEILNQYENLIARLRQFEQNCAATREVEVFNLDKPNDNLGAQLPLVEQTYADSDASDPEEAWKAFVFGDDYNDKVSKAPSQEAKQEAVRGLQPFPSQLSPDKNQKSDENSNVATVGTFYTNLENEAYENTEPHPVTEVSSNLVATYAPSPRGARSKVLVRTSNDFGRTSSIGAVAGISTVLGNDSVVDFWEKNGPLPILWPDARTSGSHAVAPSVTTSMAVAPAVSNTEPSETSTMTDHFRFSQPKLFVGSRSKQAQPKHVTEPNPGITLTKRRRGRPRRRTNDGRADIRALPNYTGDPIEDFEDKGRVHENEKALRSLFPMLELA